MLGAWALGAPAVSRARVPPSPRDVGAQITVAGARIIAPLARGSGRPEARLASGGLGHSSGGQALRRLKRRGSSGGPSWTRTFAAAAGIQRSSSPDDDAEGGFPSSEASDKEANAQTIMVFLVELGLMAMSIVDTAMVGHVGEEALAAASLGGIATWLVIITNMGLVGGLDPLTSQAHGAGNDAAVARYLHSGIRAAFLLAALGSLAMLGAEPLFTLCGQPAALAAAAAHYCRVEAFGILPVLIFQTFRLSLVGTNHFGPLVAAVGCANVLNVFLNQVLINGVAALNIPASGLTGAAWATVASRWALFFLVSFFARVPLAERGAARGVLDVFLQPRRGWNRAMRLLRQGLAIGAQMFLEFGAFAAMSLIAGRCGATAAAGHAIIQCLTDASYVIPLGIGALGSVKVGQSVGAGNLAEARDAARSAMIRGALGVAFNAAVFLFLGHHICWWFTRDAAVHATAVAILPVVATYQAADGVRVVGAGCLRGVGRVRAALISDVVGFWVIGIPLAYHLALRRGMEAMGIWWGLCVGMIAVMASVCVKAWGVGSVEEKPLEA